MLNNELTFEAGEYRAIPLSIKTGPSPHVPQDLTGCTVYFAMKKTSKGPRLIYKESTNSAQIEITDAENGLVTIYIDPVDTISRCQTGATEQYIYDIWVRFPDGNPKPVIRATPFYVTPNVYVSYPAP